MVWCVSKLFFFQCTHKGTEMLLTNEISGPVILIKIFMPWQEMD